MILTSPFCSSGPKRGIEAVDSILLAACSKDLAGKVEERCCNFKSRVSGRFSHRLERPAEWKGGGAG